MDIEESQLKVPPPQGDTGMKKTDYEIDLDPSWPLNKLHQKVKEDVMQSALAVKDPAYLDQMKVYMVDNNEFTTLDPSKTCGDQSVKSGGHVLFTRAPKESLNVDRYSIVARLHRE